MRNNQLEFDVVRADATTCEGVQSILTEFVRDEKSAAFELRDAMKHVAGCYACERFLSDSRGLSRLLGKLSSSDRNLEVPAKIELQLLSAFRAQPMTTRRLLMLPSFTALQGTVLKLAAIAAALALITVAVLLASRTARLKGPSATKDPQATASVSPSSRPGEPNAPTVGNDVEAGIPGDSGPIGPDKAAKHGPQVTVHDRRHQYRRSERPMPTLNEPDPQGEITTEFMSLGPPGYWQPMEGGAMVRVELPRSALASYGLPLAPERSNTLVKADVVVGEDGFPRAVRFVR